MTLTLDSDGVETSMGGIWYLVNVLLDLDILDRADAPLDAWVLLRALASVLLQEPPPDPVWAILDGLGDPASTLMVRARLPEIVETARARLASAGFEMEEIPSLLGQAARLFVTRTHIDLVFRLDQIDLRGRLAGLDRDPGWAPAFGRVITFHYR
jgi:hypothetical protein